LRASLEKTARRKVQEVRSEAREELNAAVVQTIADSQADLGTASTEEAVRTDALQAGTKIRVRGFTKPVIFRRLDGSSAEIEAGPLRMKVAIAEIVGIVKDESATAASSKRGSSVGAGLAPPGGTVTVRRSSEHSGAASNELNVIGMTVEQATELVDKFLD